MNLTKEEYIDIIENLDFFYGDNLITTAELRKIKHRETQKKDLENFKKKINCLKQLINEHFDNTPLKFEELKENMWVWDNKTKSYIFIFKPLNWEPIKGIRYANMIIYHSAEGYYMDFEENRFFRYEVKNDHNRKSG